MTPAGDYVKLFLSLTRGVLVGVYYTLEFNKQELDFTFESHIGHEYNTENVFLLPMIFVWMSLAFDLVSFIWPHNPSANTPHTHLRHLSRCFANMTTLILLIMYSMTTNIPVIVGTFLLNAISGGRDHLHAMRSETKRRDSDTHHHTLATLLLVLIRIIIVSLTLPYVPVDSLNYTFWVLGVVFVLEPIMFHLSRMCEETRKYKRVEAMVWTDKHVLMQMGVPALIYVSSGVAWMLVVLSADDVFA